MSTHNMMNRPIAKNRRWKLVTLALSMTIGASISSAEQQPTFVEESLEAYNERMQWFVDAQYGLFIHFGVYSQLGGEFKGRPMRKMKYSEWIAADLEIPREEYAEIIKDFNPTQFDADLIVRTAKAAGMKYLVITSKHHDGFCLWDSDYTEFDVGNTPFKGRDILAELNEACKKHGIKFGLYYSVLDWNHPTQVPSLQKNSPNWRWGRTYLRDGGDGEDKQTYVTYQKNQLLELIKNYDPAILWFDGEWVEWWTVEDGIDLYNTIRTASSHVIMNNRVGKRKSFEADFVCKEQRHFEKAFPKHWEACYTMNKSWGYKKGDDDWKDAATVYEKLKDVNEKGGNLLLNVGPDGNGVVQDEAVSILLETGKMLEANPIEKKKPTIKAVPRLVTGPESQQPIEAVPSPERKQPIKAASLHAGQKRNKDFDKLMPSTLKHPPETEARLNKWFRDSKFGAFIHFGAYSPLAGKYKDRVTPKKYAEWVQMDLGISYEEYRKEVVGQFNPTEFDAEEWVKLFKATGMRHVVITSKHHDGFALYDSACSDYDVMDASPFKCDIIKELSEACHRHGLKFGVYYSQAKDWSDPDSSSFTRRGTLKSIHPNLPEDYKPDMDAYIARKALPQIEELLKNYQIDLIWFDTPRSMTRERAVLFSDAVRRLNPDCVINSRLYTMAGASSRQVITPEMLEIFDYFSLGDKEVPPKKLPLTTESPDSVSSSYGYKAHGEHHYHSLQELIHRLVHTVCAGGSYLLNCGPMGNGRIDPKAVELFSGIGDWIRDNHESIYDTEANPLPSRPEWGDASLSKDGKTLYLHVMKWPANGKICVGGVPIKAASAAFLAPKGADQKISLSQVGASIALDLPAKAIDEHDSVIKVLLESPFPVQ